MIPSPAFLVYGRDRLEFRFQRLTLAAQGAVWKLECLMWTNGTDQCSLPDNNAWLARALGTTVEHWLELRNEIQGESDQYFEEKEGCLSSKDMRAEARRQRKFRKSQSEKGTLSAERRFNRGSTAVQPGGNLSLSSSLSPSSQKKKEALCTKRGLSDTEFIQALKDNPIYRHLDIDHELGKLDAWLLTPRGRGKQKTRNRIVAWLGHAADDQRPVAIAGESAKGCVWRMNGNTRRQLPCGKEVASGKQVCAEHEADQQRVAALIQ